MGRLMNTQIENVLDALFSGVALDAPASWKVGLSSTAPANDGTNITEPVGNAYAQVSTNANTTDWPLCAAGTRQKSNGITVLFPEATGTWGDMTHFVLYGPTGAARAWGQLNGTYSIVAGVQASFAPGTLVITGTA